MKSFLLLGIILGLVGVSVIPTAFAAAKEDDAQVTTLFLRASMTRVDTHLSLQDALKIAIEENRDRRVALSSVKEAKAAYLARLTSFLPDFKITQPYSRYTTTLDTPGVGTTKVDNRVISPQMVFRFSLLPKGQQILQAKIAKKELEAARDEEQAAIQETLWKTAMLYYELEYQLQNVEIAQLQLAETQQNLALQEERLNAGVGRERDRLLAETKFVEAQEQYVKAIQASECASLKLNEVLNLPVISTVIPAGETRDVHTLIRSDSDFETLLSEVEKRNPTLKALSKKTESLTQLFKPQNIAVALLPEVYVQWRSGKSGITRDEAAPFQETSYGIGLSYSNLGLTSAVGYKGFRAKIDGMKNETEAERNRIVRELSEAWLVSKSMQEQGRLARKKMQLAMLGREAVLTDIKDNRASTLELLKTQESLNTARQSLNQTTLAYNQAQASIVYALGLASVDGLTQGVYLL